MGVEIQGHIRVGAEIVAEVDREVRDALTAFGAEAAETFRQRWVGFRHPTGRSRAAWRAEPVQQSGAIFSIEITNDARRPGDGKPYAGYVHTPGNPEPLAEYLRVTAVDPMAAALTRRLANLPALDPTED